MDVEEFIAKAWEAVQKSGLPEPLQETAFKEATQFLRTTDPERVEANAGLAKHERPKKTSRDVSGNGRTNKDPFFARLSHETAIDESDLRDILELTSDGNVHVAPPTKNLGASLSEQARTVVTLVAGARAVGLGEDPVDGEAVRTEVKRKRCFDTNNYSGKVLGHLKGLNVGAKRNQLVMTSKWVDEFKAAVDVAHGRNQTSSES